MKQVQVPLVDRAMAYNLKMIAAGCEQYQYDSCVKVASYQFDRTVQKQQFEKLLDDLGMIHR